MADTTVVRKPKGEKVERQFYDQAGEVTSRVGPESVGVKLLFLENGQTLDMSFESLKPEIARAAALFGVMTSVTNTFGGMVDPGEMFEAAESRWETLVAGSWSSERQSGPRIGDLVEAVMRLRKEKGASATDSDREDVKARIISGELNAKGLLATPAVAAHFHAIKRERADARAQEAAAKAGEAQTDLSALLA